MVYKKCIRKKVSFACCELRVENGSNEYGAMSDEALKMKCEG